MDASDKKILRVLQENGRATLSEISEQVHLSTSQVQRRVTRLESAGVIEGYAAKVNPEALGMEVIAYVDVVLKHQDTEAAENFHREVLKIDEILECHRISGDADYHLKVVAASLKDYSEIAQKIIVAIPVVDRVESRIVFESPKQTSALPVR